MALVASEVLLTARTFIGDNIGGTMIVLTTTICGQLQTKNQRAHFSTAAN
jgi:hypothetical protein